jgi:FtsZ-binding cell division protein ZapB
LILSSWEVLSVEPVDSSAQRAEEEPAVNRLREAKAQLAADVKDTKAKGDAIGNEMNVLKSEKQELHEKLVRWLSNMYKKR